MSNWNQIKEEINEKFNESSEKLAASRGRTIQLEATATMEKIMGFNMFRVMTDTAMAMTMQ